jgi:hypothetical protein
MATLAYPYSLRDSANTTTDNRKSGMVPTIGNGNTLASPPVAVTAAGNVSFVEIGWGDYIFLYDAEVHGDASFPVDWGAALTKPNDRYGSLILTRDSGRVLASMQAVSFIAPNNAGIAAIQAAIPAIDDGIAAIQAQTDQLTFTGPDVNAVTSGAGADPFDVMMAADAPNTGSRGWGLFKQSQALENSTAAGAITAVIGSIVTVSGMDINILGLKLRQFTFEAYGGGRVKAKSTVVNAAVNGSNPALVDLTLADDLSAIITTSDTYAVY